MKTLEINNKHYIDAKVVILATYKPSNLILEDKVLKYHPSKIDVGIKNYQHLYFTSNEEIKEGDWCLDFDLKRLYQSKTDEHVNIFNKIIATTDDSLKSECQGCRFNKNSPGIIYSCSCQLLPQPSKEFIQQYIESYNKDKVITDVLVGVEFDGLLNYLENNYYQLKLQDNTIIIKEKEDSWDDIYGIYMKEYPDYYSKSCKKSLPQWLKENYHSPIKK